MSLEAEALALEEEVRALMALENPPLGTLVDAAYAAKVMSTRAGTIQTTLKALMDEARFRAKDVAQAQGLESANGAAASLHLSEKDFYNAEDWGGVYEYLDQTKNYSILQRRLSSTVLKELEDAGDSVPGVSKTTVIEPSLTKRKQSA
jgi:hypothetical protein